MTGTMTQTAPYPAILEKLVGGTTYKEGWDFVMYDRDRGQGSKGLTLSIYIEEPDTYHPEKMTRIVHHFIVPAASYNERSWRRWLFERILEVERHESAEFFQIDGVRPYAPHHGPGNDPYIIFEHGTDEEMRTSYLGVRRDEYDPESEKKT
jgi:hypothetical protein